MDTGSFSLLLVFAASMTFSPGPANLTLLGTSVQLGVRRTLPMLAGVVSGFVITAIAVCIGLGELFQRVPVLLQIVRVLGSLYILYLAYGLWQARHRSLSVRSAERSGFIRGLLVHPLNPKAWMMLITAYSQFVSPGNIVISSVILVSVFTVCGLMANGLWTAVGSGLHKALQIPRLNYGIFTSLSVCMLGLAITLWVM